MGGGGSCYRPHTAGSPETPGRSTPSHDQMCPTQTRVGFQTKGKPCSVQAMLTTKTAGGCAGNKDNRTKEVAITYLFRLNNYVHLHWIFRTTITQLLLDHGARGHRRPERAPYI